MVYTPPKVSRHFRYDWQFAVELARLPLLRTASLVISVMPIALELSRGAFDISWPIPLSLRLTWASSILYLLAWVILQFKAPKFVKEYRDFGHYQNRHHSHRWIVWEFYNNIKKLHNWQIIVRETREKGISRFCEEVDDLSVYSACPAFPPEKLENETRIYYPVNLNRDIYLPITHANRRIVLLLQEDDPHLDRKEKELFWILFTQAAKERLLARALFWILVYAAGVMFGASIIWNAIRVIPGL